MKLQNEETGQVENFCIDKDKICSCDRAFVYDSLKQLQEAGWKDYEEPKENWFIASGGEVVKATYITDHDKTILRKFGNYFETKEDAEKAVEKLKAWKRLKDKGFKFIWLGMEYKGDWCKLSFNKDEDEDWVRENMEDLRLLFGGEE
jgi:RecA-family ATPase